MAAEIGPGTLLECIGRPTDGGDLVQIGRVYNCVAVATRPPWVGACNSCDQFTDGVKLAELVGFCFCPCLFRPIPPRSKHVDALLEKLKTPAKVPEPA